MLSAINWDPNPRVFTIPYLNIPILWYGVFFALGFAIGFPIFVNILTRYLGKDQKKKATHLADRLTLYMILATVIGARVGHFIFYEHPSEYLRDPLSLLRTWEGGLASHGAAIAIPVALYIFARRHPPLTMLRLLDFVCVPTAFAGALIRLGNFMNQEIFGTPTDLPWAVIFGHPADRSVPVPRHPTQIYEAFFYLLTFFVLFRLSYTQRFLRTPGLLIGLFLTLVFGFRILVECIKLEHSRLMTTALTMGQILSFPALAVGFYLLFRSRKK